MFIKSMNLEKRLNRENCCFSNYSFQSWLLIGSMKISAQYSISVTLLGKKTHRDMGRGYHCCNSENG